MKKETFKVLNPDYALYLFNEIMTKDDIVETFFNQFKNDKSICGNFYKMYNNNEINLQFKKIYKAYYYLDAEVVDAKYTYIKEVKNEFNENVYKTYFDNVSLNVELYDNELFRNGLFYNDKLLYEYSMLDGNLTENDFHINNKSCKKFLEEYDYKLVLGLYNELYEKHQISQDNKYEKVILDPISNLSYEKRIIYLEPLLKISFDYIEGNKPKTYDNYISLTTNKVVFEKSFPKDAKYKEFYKRNRPSFLVSLRFNKEEVEYFTKEKYNLSLILDEEFNKLTPQETINRALIYIKDDKIKEGILYIKKAYYLYNCKKVNEAFLYLAKEYLQKETFDYKRALYYLSISNTSAISNYLMSKLYFKGIIRGVSYFPDGVYHLKIAAKYKDYNSSLELYHHFSSYRYLDKKQALRYFKLAEKYKKK